MIVSLLRSRSKREEKSKKNCTVAAIITQQQQSVPTTAKPGTLTVGAKNSSCNTNYKDMTKQKQKQQ